MPERSRDAVIGSLVNAFRGQQHDMLLGGTINASPDRHRRIRQLLAKSPDKLSADDLDWLVFKAMSTVGGVPTFKFALVRFLAMVLEDEALGGGLATDSYVILPKLDQAGFDRWTKDERTAMLDALELWADMRHALAAADELADESCACEITDWVKARRQLI